MKPIVFQGSAVALVTPMRADLTVDYDALGTLVDFHLVRHTDALVVAGTTGEAATLSDEEQRGIIEYCVRRVNGRIPVIAGAGSNNTAHAVFLSRQAERCGADALLHVTPYYNKASQNGLYLHFRACAEATALPVILYNVPSRTGVNMLPETCRRLAELPNIVAVKEASGNFSQMAKIVSLCGDELAIYSGNDDQITSALALGAKGVVSVLANLVPEATHAICQSYFDGDAARSDTLQLQFLELIENLFIDVSPIPVKQALQYMGFAAGGCRLPLCGLEPAAAERLLACMKRYGLARTEARVGTVTVKRPQGALLWRKNH